MKKVLLYILVFLDFAAFCLSSICFWLNALHGRTPFWGIPFIVAGLLALAGGIVTIKNKKNWVYGVLGLIIAVVISIYTIYGLIAASR
jgi:hypothetical protein